MTEEPSNTTIPKGEINATYFPELGRGAYKSPVHHDEVTEGAKLSPCPGSREEQDLTGKDGALFANRVFQAMYQKIENSPS